MKLYLFCSSEELFHLVPASIPLDHLAVEWGKISLFDCLTLLVHLAVYCACAGSILVLMRLIYKEGSVIETIAYCSRQSGC